MPVICPDCGTENSAGRKFCGGCGAPLARACAACGAPNEPGVRFCGECGSSLEEAHVVAPPAPPTPGPAPAAERRLVSVLFADLVGFTSLSESRDPEVVRELLSRYFDTCRRLIGLYGGTVEKFIGDAVMAVWGTPVATEDDAERAVRAALDLVTAVSALGDEVGAAELRARAGVLTGEAAVTLGAEGQGMVAGDLVNTASRVQSVAQPGTVYVGESTRRAAEQTVAFEAAGSFELKGKEGETPLWRALRVVSGIRGSLRSEGLEPPFVGRGRELRQIKDLYHACAEERKAHLVSVTGIAGIGKSRLAWEFYKYFDGIVETVLWHRGRCLAYGEGITYWALADMVRMRCRIAEDEPVDQALAKLRATLDQYAPDVEDRRFVEPRLAQLLGLGDFEARDRQEMFAAWRLFFERLAETNPTVLVFEDLQWADASLLDFVEYLLDWSRTHPLFVVTLARPELLERRPTWGAGLRSFTSLYLEPLAGQAMEELLEGLVPGLPGSLRDRILERAEGVPLYAVETVRMLIDRGLLVRDGPVYRPAGEIEALEVPETLHALVAARLDGLDERERRLLQDGAVLGKTFTAGGLSALGGQPAGDLEPVLASLVRKEVLSLQADPRSPEYGQFGFLQDLVRRVAYETLARRDRRARHLAAADYLAAGLGEDEAAEVVASHLLNAYRELPDAPDADEVKARAKAALVRAGERAEQLAAPGEAQRYYDHATELGDDPRDRARLAGRAGRAAYRAGRPEDARSRLDDAHAGFEALGDTRAAALVAAELADLDFLDHHPPQAVARLEPALAALRDGGSDAEVAVLSAQLGRFLFFSGERERVASHLEAALSLAEALDLPETLAEALNSKALLLMVEDRLYEARLLLEGALSLSLAHHLHSAALRSYNNLIVILQQLDAFRESDRFLDQGLELARRIGDRRWESNFLAGSLGTLVVFGKWDEALARVEEARKMATTAYVHGLTASVLPIYSSRGDLVEARRLLAEQSASAESDDPQFSIGYRNLEARVLRAEGRVTESLAVAERAFEAARALGLTSWPAKAALANAFEAAAALGDTDVVRRYLAVLDELRPGELTAFLKALQERFRAHVAESAAEPHFVAAEGLFHDLGGVLDLALTKLEHAEWLVAQGRGVEAADLLGEARETFERLRATPWLERLAAVETGIRAGATA
jgi:class 3 adenylate cyclase/tetratricopeptide (TPR) repeat protein